MYERHKGGGKLESIRYAHKLHDVAGLELKVIERATVSGKGYSYFVDHLCNPLERSSDKIVYTTKSKWKEVFSTETAEAKKKKVETVSRFKREKAKRALAAYQNEQDARSKGQVGSEDAAG